jgi:UDP-2,3-diacylglucosamine hydrolase
MDRPERARRFSRWVGSLDGSDTLLILGDLCDFWMATRCRQSHLMDCQGIKALVDFRSRGGNLATMPGNHDRWLCDFYEQELSATILPDPFDTTIAGLRLHLVHGHLLGARRIWKAGMESHVFFRAFAMTPTPLASVFDQLLESRNQSDLEEDERRHLLVFRRYAAARRGVCDLVVIGHVHRAVDDNGADPRMIVLGGWQTQSSFLRIDAAGASFHRIADDPTGDAPAPVAGMPATSAESRCPTP